jgi:ZF-HD class homeobox domain-containing protein
MHQQQHQERPREVYRECMRNHAAKLGTYASDGCCEYTPDDGQPAPMLCAACGCHRNFHRKTFLDAAAGAHGAMLPSPAGASPGYGSGTHHTATTAAGMGGDAGAHGSGGRRRTRTKFTEEQKECMARFAERLGWRMPKREPGRAPGDDEVGRFCREIGVTRQVFKVWMHNHKSGGGRGGAGAGAGGAAQTSSSTTRGGGSGAVGGGGSMSPAICADVEDDEEVMRGSGMCM